MLVKRDDDNLVANNFGIISSPITYEQDKGCFTAQFTYLGKVFKVVSRTLPGVDDMMCTLIADTQIAYEEQDPRFVRS